MSRLFSSFNISGVLLKNRIVMPPMCMYKVEDDSGKPNDFHNIHYSSCAIGGAGLIIVEATAVQSYGRITNRDLGLWDDEQILAHKILSQNIKRYGSVPAVQLAHAGRKSMCIDSVPTSCTNEPFDDGYKTPNKMSLDDILKFKTDFVNAAIRAEKAGYEMIEIHAAHGYLINQFLSKKLNKRDDIYKDGSLLLIEILKEIKNSVKIAVGVRLSASSWQSDDYDIDECIKICKDLEANEADFLHISSGGIHAKPDDMPIIAPLYQCEYAKKIRENVKIPVIAVGLINGAATAEALLLGEVCDLVAFGRAMLADSNLAFKMAAELREKELIDSSYLRAF